LLAAGWTVLRWIWSTRAFNTIVDSYAVTNIRIRSSNTLFASRWSSLRWIWSKRTFDAIVNSCTMTDIGICSSRAWVDHTSSTIKSCSTWNTLCCIRSTSCHCVRSYWTTQTSRWPWWLCICTIRTTGATTGCVLITVRSSWAIAACDGSLFTISSCSTLCTCCRCWGLFGICPSRTERTWRCCWTLNSPEIIRQPHRCGKR